MKKIIACFYFLFVVSIAMAQHLVVLKAGARVKGEVATLASGKLTMYTAEGNKSYQLDEISLIYLDEALVPKVQDINTTLPSGTVTASVPGRRIEKMPNIKLMTQDKGIVVVNVSVDKYGHVVKAEPGAEGTNTTMQYLLTKAKQAAEATMFDSNPTHPIETKGTITVVF